MDENPADKIKQRVNNEPYARLLGIKVTELSPGHSVVKMTIKEDYNNFLDITHGGAIFSLLDVAFGSAANSYGTISVALNVNISYIKPSNTGDELIARADEVARSNKTANFFIIVKNQHNEIVATAAAVAYMKKEKLPFLN